MSLKKIIALSAAAIFVSSTAMADMNSYMSNIMSSFSNLQPEAYHLQQRGYFVGGTMHIPPMGENIKPFSITLPSFKNNSCGGIDVMMGGFSYLNFDYLVQKLQSIIQAAPALAFEIAVKVLSEKLGGVMQSLESVTNAINNLNFNSCEAMNGIVTTSSNAITEMLKGTAQSTTKKQATGGGDYFGHIVTDAFDKVKDFFNDIFQSKVDTAKSVADGDENKAKEMIAGVPDNGLLNGVARELNGLPSDFINMMRYYLGDVIPVKDPSSGTVGLQVLYPCGNTSTPKGFIRDLSSGKMHELTFDSLQNGSCQGTELSTSDSLTNIVEKDMEDIVDSLLTGSNMPQASINLIEISPIPIYSYLRNAVILGGGYSDILTQQLAKPIAFAIAANFASYFTRKVMSASTRLSARASVAAPGSSRDEIREYIKHLMEFQYKVQKAEYDAIKQAQEIYGDFMQRYINMQKQVSLAARNMRLSNAINFAKIHGGM